ncbi:Visual system homeobox 1 [Pteropus alecto]|uniref:Visual system homeobox 1 n=1 Tax=Pteropus alecto TaxID=9402 RepID=L5JZI6_PTEAL|nr:Visual system homeobox 1 [Pteropus alecto]
MRSKLWGWVFRGSATLTGLFTVARDQGLGITAWRRMYKKSTRMIRKPGNEEKLAQVWGPYHLKEVSSPSQARPQRVSKEASLENDMADVAIDLSSSTGQETRKAYQDTNAQGSSDSEELEGLQPGV